MAPIHDAFSVPEILEEIIVNLPLREIVPMRALCREVSRIIDQTSTIQRSLFLQSSSAETLTWIPPWLKASHAGIEVTQFSLPRR